MTWTHRSHLSSDGLPFYGIVIFAARRFMFTSVGGRIMTQRGRSAWAIGPRAERSMTNQDDEEKKNMRIMWIASGLIVLGIVVLMVTIGTTPTMGPTDTTAQSQTVPTQ